MSDTATSSKSPVVIQIKLRTLGIAAAFAVICFFSINAVASSAVDPGRYHTYKIIRSESFSDINDLEYMMRFVASSGLKFSDNVVVQRTATRNGRAVFQLDEGGGGYLILRQKGSTY